MSNRNVLQKREFQDLISKLNNADGYFIGVTVLKNGVNHHSILTDTFPFADLLRSLKKVKDLCVEELERDLNTIPKKSGVKMLEEIPQKIHGIEEILTDTQEGKSIPFPASKSMEEKPVDEIPIEEQDVNKPQLKPGESVEDGSSENPK